jgi:hypothetical protein
LKEFKEFEEFKRRSQEPAASVSACTELDDGASQRPAT